MKTNGQMVGRRDLVQPHPTWEQIRMTATGRKGRAVKDGHRAELLLYAINLILLALIVYGMYHGLQNWLTRGF